MYHWSLIFNYFVLFFSSRSCDGKCDGCVIDKKPPVSIKKWYQKWWCAFKQMVSYDLTSNLISSAWMMYDVSTDIEAGLEYWDDGDPLWAIATWSLMFVPSSLSFAMEVMFKKCKISWKKVFGHLPLCQVRERYTYRISSYSCRGNYSFLNSSSEETIQVFISLM